jgi:hypothetical protein
MLIKNDEGYWNVFLVGVSLEILLSVEVRTEVLVDSPEWRCAMVMWKMRGVRSDTLLPSAFRLPPRIDCAYLHYLRK